MTQSRSFLYITSVTCTSMGKKKTKKHLLISGLEKSSARLPLTVMMTVPLEYTLLILHVWATYALSRSAIVSRLSPLLFSAGVTVFVYSGFHFFILMKKQLLFRKCKGRRASVIHSSIGDSVIGFVVFLRMP